MPARSTGDGAAVWRYFERLLDEGKLSPFYLLFGKERYFVREAVARLKERTLPPDGSRELLFHSVVGSEASGAELAALARTEPFFEQTQLILVREAERLRDPDQKELEAYARDPAPFTRMVFLAGEEFPKGALFAFLKKRYPAACMGFAPLKRAACVDWVLRAAKEKGLASRLSPDMVEGLVETGQGSLEILEQQLTALALYLRDPGEGDALAGILPFALPEVAFQQSYRLTDRLLEGDLGGALAFLNRFLDQGISPLALLGRIASEVRKLWQIKHEMERGAVSDAFLRACRIQPFKKTMYTAAARRLSWGALAGMLHDLGEADRLLKSSRLDPRLHLEALCEGMARRLAAGGRLRG